MGATGSWTRELEESTIWTNRTKGAGTPLHETKWIHTNIRWDNRRFHYNVYNKCTTEYEGCMVKPCWILLNSGSDWKCMYILNLDLDLEIRAAVGELSLPIPVLNFRGERKSPGPYEIHKGKMLPFHIAHCIFVYAPRGKMQTNRMEQHNSSLSTELGLSGGLQSSSNKTEHLSGFHD